MEIIKRRHALSLGLTRYFTGKPCSHGHIAERFSSSGYCVECNNLRVGAERLPDCELVKLFKYDKETGDLWYLVGGEYKLVRSKARHKSIRNVYYRVNVMGKHYFAHRIIWLINYGKFPEEVVDHIDGNGLNNRLENLRSVSNTKNSRNCRLSKNNTTGVNGVWKNGNKYVAEIMVDRKKISLGSYCTIEEARDARKAAEIEYEFHELHGTIKE